MSTRANRTFFNTDSKSLARALLGQHLVRVLDGGSRLAGRIVEVEAYTGVKDRASHAFGGRRTPRNESMYAQPGTAYVYFTYGMHWCMNVVCGQIDEPVAVLIRALEPTEGLELMRLHRSAGSRQGRVLRDTDLCSGPARLCDALEIDRRLNGIDLTSDDRLFIERVRGKVGKVRTSPRIGIGNAGAWTARKLRWYLAGNPHVSGRPR